jgi:hypothetical protein
MLGAALHSAIVAGRPLWPAGLQPTPTVVPDAMRSNGRRLKGFISNATCMSITNSAETLSLALHKQPISVVRLGPAALAACGAIRPSGT